MSNDNGIEKRRFIRLRYPADLAPTLYVHGSDYPLLEVSEEGLVFSCPGMMRFAIGQLLSAEATFHDGQEYRLYGRVLRIRRNGGVIVHLSRGIPSERMALEQRYLLNKRQEALRAKGLAN